jgi:hypothetical protein
MIVERTDRVVASLGADRAQSAKLNEVPVAPTRIQVDLLL